MNNFDEELQQSPKIPPNIPKQSYMPDWADTLATTLSFKKILALRDIEADIFFMNGVLYVKSIKGINDIVKLERKDLDEPDEPNELNRGGSVTALPDMLGDGLLTRPTGPIWHYETKLLRPAVGYTGTHEEDIVMTATQLVRLINTSQDSLDVLKTMKEASLQMVIHTMIGAKGEYDSSKYFSALTKGLAITVLPTQFGSRAERIPLLGILQRYFKGKIDVFADHIIKLAIESDENNVVKRLLSATYPEEPKAKKEETQIKQRDVTAENVEEQISDDLQEAVKPRLRYTPEDVRGHIHQLIAAGQGTTAATLSFALNEILQDKNLHARLRDELAGVDLHDRKEFHKFMTNPDTLLRKVIKETLRLFPPTYLIPIGVSAPEGVVIDENFVPGGTNCQILLAVIHRDARYWENPDVFLPERWEKDSEFYKEGQEEAYLPFYKGPRGCIGKFFAEDQLFIFLSHIVKDCPDIGVAKTGKIDLSNGVTELKGFEIVNNREH